MDDQAARSTVARRLLKRLADDVVEACVLPVDGVRSASSRLQRLGPQVLPHRTNNVRDVPAHHACGMRPDEDLSAVGRLLERKPKKKKRKTKKKKKKNKRKTLTPSRGIR
jgi:hypothetical protein